jgi:hypothetical protein
VALTLLLWRKDVEAVRSQQPAQRGAEGCVGADGRCAVVLHSISIAAEPQHPVVVGVFLQCCGLVCEMCSAAL